MQNKLHIENQIQEEESYDFIGHLLNASRKSAKRLTTNKFQFVKEEEEITQEERKINFDRIKSSMKDKISLVIKKPVSSDSGSSDKMDKKYHQISKELEVDLDHFSDKVSIRPYIQELFDEYEINEYLGEGCLGLVKKVVEKQTGKKFAIKIVKTTDDEIIRNMIIEFKNLIHIEHENIVKMYKLYLDYKSGFQQEHTAYVLMEYIEGKEMFEVINELGHYSESLAKSLFKQLLSAIQYLHSKGICHRDLKPHNILCTTINGNSILKVTDFNVSKFSDGYKEFGDINEIEKIEMWTYTGTVAFSAPEIFTGEGYTQWNGINKQKNILDNQLICGVLDVFFILCLVDNYHLMHNRSLNDLIDEICQANVEFPEKLFSFISEEAKDLMRQLLMKNKQNRINAKQALNHQWFRVEDSMKRKSIRLLTLHQNINHLTARNSGKQRFRDVLLSMNSNRSIKFSSAQCMQVESPVLQKMQNESLPGGFDQITRQFYPNSLDNYQNVFDCNDSGDKQKFSQFKYLSELPSDQLIDSKGENKFINSVNEQETN